MDAPKELLDARENALVHAAKLTTEELAEITVMLDSRAKKAGRENIRLVEDIHETKDIADKEVELQELLRKGEELLKLGRKENDGADEQVQELVRQGQKQ